ncbi:MAG: TROVE domain-containing protein [Alphaproteobacteria bacterium]|nr:TROVE domain-containing protein [Alphaproteobacteria bacterium]
MSYKAILQSVFPSKSGQTPQTEPLPGQVPNNAGGYFYAVDDWTLLDRFLVLGTEAGTYYVSPVQLTKDNAAAIQRLLVTDGLKVVERIVAISKAGRAPKNDAALFALALAAACDDQPTRQAALAALPKVARTGSHLLQFAEYVNSLRGWGRALRKAVGKWFTDMPVEQLTLQAVKYAQREGWALRDLLRLAHPQCGEDEARRAVISWIVRPEQPEAIVAARQLRLIEGKYLAKEAASVEAVADIVRQYSLPREAIPTEALQSVAVWDALLVDMPMTAMIRNLGKMSQIGLLQPFGAASDYVAERLRDREQLTKTRINPFQLLLAMRTYAKGRGELGSLTWTPVAPIVAALDEAFESSFASVTPTNARILVGVDVSGSMRGTRCAGSRILSAVEAAAAVATFLVRTEPKTHVMAFDTEAREFAVTPKQRLDDVVASVAKWGGGTDLSLPVTYALERKLEVDAFIILTDSETWAGKQHTVQALHQYRQRINPRAKLVVMAAAANGGTICDPADPLSFGVAGFDAAAPQLVMDFIREAA